MSLLIEIREVSKSFGRESVIKPTSNFFEKGKIYGICGRNGSGKTVFLKLICGFLKPDTGTIQVSGKLIGKDCDFAENTGILIEQPGFLKTKSGFLNLKYLANIQKKIGDNDIKRAMEAVGLDWRERKWVCRYSMGMRQRLGIAQAIMEKPELLILDEPINGLDTEGAELIRSLLKKMRDDGKTILIASHLREDLEDVCDQVYRISGGEIHMI